MRRLIDCTEHNVAKYTSYLVSQGYPILDTQNVHIKIRSDMPRRLISSQQMPPMPPIAPIPPSRPSALAVVILSVLMFEYLSH
jgi:hypothetical protein